MSRLRNGMRLQASHSRLRVAFLPIKSKTACCAEAPPPQGLRRDKLCRRWEEGRIHLLIHLPIEEEDENRWCLWRPDHAGFDSRSIFEGALVEGIEKLLEKPFKVRFFKPTSVHDLGIRVGPLNRLASSVNWTDLFTRFC